MTRTDVMASSGPMTAGAARTKTRLLRGRRRLALLPVLLLMALALAMPGVAVAAGTSTEGTSKYNTEPEKPKEGTSPSKEASEPSKEKSPSTASTAPSSEKASTLPFTGFDLRWSIGLGLVLMGAGVAIVIVQRRRAER